MCVYTLTVHLMRLSGLFQLGKNQTAAALRGSVDLKHLVKPESQLEQLDDIFNIAELGFVP